MLWRRHLCPEEAEREAGEERKTEKKEEDKTDGQSAKRKEIRRGCESRTGNVPTGLSETPEANGRVKENRSVINWWVNEVRRRKDKVWHQRV